MTGEGPARLPRWALLAAAFVAAVLVLVSSHPQRAEAARGMDLGVFEPEFSFTPFAQTLAFDRAVQARSRFVLIYVTWAGVAPSSKPPGFDPSNPSDPAYDWSSIDNAVQNASARGFNIVLAITKAPPWAEGPNRPGVDTAPQGTWDPDPAEVGNFTRAIATRYSGNFMGLPAVRYWQLWAEPNLAVNLGPQFDGNTPIGFEVYRPMLNAFYANLKAVSGRNIVVVGGTAPYGNLTPAGGLVYQRMQPLTFWRGLLCYSSGKRKKKGKKKKKKNRAVASRTTGARLIPQPCPNPARFDVAAHHPINVGAPTRSALNPDDASTPDIGRLRRIVRAAEGSGRAPGGPHPIWATEIWWNSKPPGDKGLPLGKHARYLEQGFYVLWKQGVAAAFWFELRDAEPGGGLPIPTSGLFFRDGSPKPALRAYQFPFVTERLSRTRVRAWGEAPRGGPVSIQVRRGKKFKNLKTMKAGDNRVFVGILSLRRKALLRATQGNESSLVWKQG